MYNIISCIKTLYPKLTTRKFPFNKEGLVTSPFSPNKGKPFKSAPYSKKSFEMENANKSEQEWKAVLTPEQFHILREKGTEPAGSGEYNKFFKNGEYLCAGCKAPLYKSTSKFDSGCGWPAFFEALPGAVTRTEDNSFGSRRTEITCSNCGGHLGHVFLNEGFKNPTNERHCVNSVSMLFKE
ncbi:Peptide methionine sulfoxide reductase B2, chloroplastic [Entomophthora muscae]|uniref:Peptide methionine sulfoxide reductase B2, chloroplastic n=1 Tax=Entomophthora muscae TaxID=34485 RepID=A0ACC2RQA9_9FUNG|nr:Peptide methionine sulfoxide reductase B2, chloroplastic [Entomophthora muscae]